MGLPPKYLFQCSEVLHQDISQMDHHVISLMIFSIVYKLLLYVLQLWFVLTVPEDFKLLNWIYSSCNLQNIWLWAFRQHSLNYVYSVSISHGGDKVLQTCERYVPAEMFDPFYMSGIKAVHHFGGTRRHQELHLCCPRVILHPVGPFIDTYVSIWYTCSFHVS